jgi:hypothetical protein
MPARISPVFGALTATVLAAASAPAAPCRAPLPHGPAVPAPIIFKTDCGGFWLDTDGDVARLPRGWFAARSRGSGRRYGADLQLRRNRAGRIFLLRQGRLLWRSSGLYPNTAGDVTFGAHAFAFAAYRRGVFVTDLRGPERLVLPGRARYPYQFFASGRLIVTGGRAIAVLTPDGRVDRRYPYSRSGGFAFDGATNTLFFVTPRQRLATLRESRLQVGRHLASDGMVSFVKPRLLLFYGGRSLMLTSQDGRLLARAGWRRGALDVLDSGASVSPDGHYLAFRLSDARAGASKGNAILFLLARGQMGARPIYRHRLGPVGCGVGASMYWHERYLLYGSSNGQLAVIDGTSGRRQDLRQLERALPRRTRMEQPTANWLSDYPNR